MNVKSEKNNVRCFAENGVTFQMWKNIPGMALSRLITNRRFPGKPDVSMKVRRLYIRPNQGDRYGIRMTTYYVVSFASCLFMYFQAPNVGLFVYFVNISSTSC